MADSAQLHRFRLSWLTWLSLALVFGTLTIRHLLGVPCGRHGYIAYGWPRPMVVRQVDVSTTEFFPPNAYNARPVVSIQRVSRWSLTDLKIVEVIRAGLAIDVAIALGALVGAGFAIERWWRKYRPQLNLKSMLVLTGFAGTACAFGIYSGMDWEECATQFCEAVIFVSLCAAWFVVIEITNFAFDWYATPRTDCVAGDNAHPLD